MSNEIIPFKYNDIEVRALTVDGEPWFVAADIARILSYRDSERLTRQLDPDEKGTQTVGTPGGNQRLSVISEPGLYRVIMRRQSGYVDNADMRDQIKAFQRWVTHEVLPSIRKTGSYAVGQPTELTGPELMAKALLEANKTMEAQAARLLEAAPKVEAFEAFLSTNGDYSVGETAKILARHHAIITGEKRLFNLLVEWGWVYRDAKKRPLAYQAQVENGRLAMRARQWTDWATGETHPAPPQVRVTAKGLEAIAARMSDATQVKEIPA